MKQGYRDTGQGQGYREGDMATGDSEKEGYRTENRKGERG